MRLRRPRGCDFSYLSIFFFSFALLLDFSKCSALAQQVDVGLPVQSIPDKISAFQTDLFTGSATYAVPIKLPPGRNGIEPKLSLQYNSDRGYGWIGKGWELTGLGSIQRSTKRGVPKYDSTDTFTLTINGVSHDLVPDLYSYYHTSIETFLKIQYDQTGDYWIVTDTGGRQYRFGSRADSRILNPTYSKAAAWMLDRISDTHCGTPPCHPTNNPGNQVNISYVQSYGVAYPNLISYADGDSSVQDISIQFFTIDDSLGAQDNYRAGMFMARTRRLSQINITTKSGTSPIERAYVFHYLSLTGSHSNILLDHIDELGRYGSGELPPIRFSYDLGAATPLEEITLPWPFSRSSGELLLDCTFHLRKCDAIYPYLLDMDGDGKAELLSEYYENGGWYYISSLNPQHQQVYFGDFPIDFDGNDVQQIARIFGDINGDKLVDVLFVYKSCQPRQAWVALNQNGRTGPLQDAGILRGGMRGYLADIDGDGRSDYIEGGCEGSNVGYYPSKIGEGAIFGSHVDFGPLEALSSSTIWVPGDMNGDGLADLIAADCACPEGNLRYYPNLGGRFSNHLSLGAPQANVFRFVDYNLDGMTDFFHVGILQDGQPHWILNVAEGSAFSSTVLDSNIYDFVTYPGAGTRFWEQFGDINGDGAPEVVWWQSETTPGRYVSSGHAARVPSDQSLRLTGVWNQLGGITSIEYTPLPGNGAAMPMTKWVVSRVTDSDGHSISQVEYSYSGALYSGWPNNEFRGFATVTATHPLDGLTIVTHFFQDDAKKGLIQSIETKNNAGALYSRKTYEYNVVTYPKTYMPVGTIVHRTAEIVDAYDGGSTANTQRTDWANFDDYLGNAGLVTRSGTGTVSEVTQIEYRPNVDSHIVNLPWHTVTTRDGIKIRESWVAYDNASEGIAPTKGDVTQERQWLSTGGTPTVRHFYDSSGNRIGTINSLNYVCPSTGYTNAIVYDSLYKTLPAFETNALCQSVTKQYYDDLTPQSVTDPNGAVTQYSFDYFNRPVTITIAPDSSSYPTTKYTYFLNGFDPSGTLVQRRELRDDSTATIDTYTFVDGFGRPIQTRTEAPDGVNQIVVDTAYNGMGLLQSISAPYLAPKNSAYVAPNPNIAHTTLSYDPMGRVTRITNTDGSYSSRSYDHWSTTFIDASGHKRIESHDAFGRLTSVVEYSGSDGRDTTYPAVQYNPYFSTNITYTHDPDGTEVQTTTDSLGNRWTARLDSLGRKIASTDPDLGTRFYQYDFEGNLIREVDGKGQVISYTYDALNRVLVKASGLASDTISPVAPQVTATASQLPQINLAWTGASDNISVASYSIERCQGAGCTAFIPIAAALGNQSTYLDPGLLINTIYSYRIRAIDGAGNLSPYSNIVTATAAEDPTPPDAPQLSAYADLYNPLFLSWNRAFDNVGVAYYQVEYCAGRGCTNFVLLGTTTNEYYDSGACCGIFTYRVRAVDAAGNVSAYSNPVIPSLYLNFGGGSSSPSLNSFLSTQLPPSLFQTHSANTPLIHYVNGAIASDPNNGNKPIAPGKLHVWTGTLNVSQIVLGSIRFAETSSHDGLKKALGGAGNYMTFLNEAAPACSGPGVNIDRNGDGITDYIEFTGCTGTFGQTAIVALSDVYGSSFGQTGPLGVGAPKVDEYNVYGDIGGILPFKFIVGKGVKKSVSGVLAPIENLTRFQVEALLGVSSLGAKDWRRFGFVPDVDGNGVDDGGSAPVTLCLDSAGSGAKAALDQTVMLDGSEIGIQSGTVIFSATTEDKVNCVKSHPLSIGYVSADQVPNDPDDPDFVNNGGVVSVKLDGLHPYDYTLRQACGLPFGYDFLNSLGTSVARPECDPRGHLIDGRYYFWIGWKLEHWDFGLDAQRYLYGAFVSYAGNPANIAGVRAGKYWVPYSQMCVTKVYDKGPHTWISATSAPAHCSQIQTKETAN